MDERMRVLEMIEAGDVSVEEAARRLEELAEGPGAPGPETEGGHEQPVARPELVRIVWQIVFWSGTVLMVVGGLLVAAFYAWEIATGWQAFGWVLFILGLLVMAVGWWLRQARWLSVRVRQRDGPNISLAFPLPLALLAWGVRFAKPFAPQLRETAVDELILAMRDELKRGHPLVVDVDDEEDGEQVQVYFG
jgi:hypothetical protein